ncbi:MAG: FAD:protein FMN transferase, partial [Oscillospiraceae bacterium]|nr:FAD:protein FMN transferase [Oscillospiraceae bacterium]
IAALLPLVDYGQVSLTHDGTAALAAGMEIDLGSVAKGYTGDVLARLFRENGMTSGLLNLGGNVQAIGAKPDGSPWRVAIRDPLSGGNLAVLEIVDQAVITSGGYERYFEQDGETYWHILDPATGYPARSGVLSATIVGDSGVVCDGLSTALFVMGVDAAARLWREQGGFEALLVTDDGTIYLTAGLEDRMIWLDAAGDFTVEVIR